MAGELTKAKIGQEDCELQIDELYPTTFERTSSTGGNVTITKMPDIWKTHSSIRNARYHNSGAYTDTTISAAISAINGATRSLFLEPGTWAIDNDLTIPSTIHLICAHGAILQVASGKTLTINGPFTGMSQVFSGSGTVVFGDGYINKVYPQWWGADLGSTDQTSYITTALAAFSRVKLTKGTWFIKDLAIPTETILDCSGADTILKAYDDTTNGMVTFGGPSGQLRNCTIDGNTGGSKTAIGAYFSANGWGSKIENVKFINLGSYAVHVNDSNHINLKSCRFEGGTTYMVYGDKADNLLVDHSIFQLKSVTNAIRLIYTGGADAGHNVLIRNCWFEFDGTYTVIVPIYVAAQRVSIIDNKFNVTSDATQTAQVHFVDDSGSNAIGQDGYLARNTFQNVGATAKEFVIDTNVTNTIAEWNFQISAASQFTDNGTGSLIRGLHPTTGLLMQWGGAAPWYRVLTTVVDTGWNPASIADGDEEARDITVTGAALGDWVMASLSIDITDLTLDAQVTAADTVTVVLANNTGSAVDLGAVTVYVKVFDRAA